MTESLGTEQNQSYSLFKKFEYIKQHCREVERPLTMGISRADHEDCNVMIPEREEKLGSGHSEKGITGGKSFEDVLIMPISLGKHEDSSTMGLQIDEKIVNCNELSCQNNDGILDIPDICQGTYSLLVHFLKKNLNKKLEIGSETYCFIFLPRYIMKEITWYFFMFDSL